MTDSINRSDPNVLPTLKLALGILPAYALSLACTYYYTLFSNFNGLRLNILDIKDYLNKSVEFLPLALFASAFLFFFLVKGSDSFPRVDETIEDFFKRKNTTYEKYQKNSLRQHKFMIAGTAILFLAMFLFFPFSFFVRGLAMLAITVITFLVYLSFRTKNADSFVTKFLTESWVIIGLFLIAFHLSIFQIAMSDAFRIKDPNTITESNLVDIIGAGYLKRDGITLVLEDTNGNVISRYPFRHSDRRSIACRWGVRFTCFGMSKKPAQSRAKLMGDALKPPLSFLE